MRCVREKPVQTQDGGQRCAAGTELSTAALLLQAQPQAAGFWAHCHNLGKIYTSPPKGNKPMHPHSHSLISNTKIQEVTLRS